MSADKKAEADKKDEPKTEVKPEAPKAEAKPAAKKDEVKKDEGEKGYLKGEKGYLKGAEASAPAVGDSVFVKVDPRSNGGADEAAAIVTRVHDVDSEDGVPLVNVRVFLDGPDVEWRSTLHFFDSRPDDDDLAPGQLVAYRAAK